MEKWRLAYVEGYILGFGIIMKKQLIPVTNKTIEKKIWTLIMNNIDIAVWDNVGNEVWVKIPNAIKKGFLLN